VKVDLRTAEQIIDSPLAKRMANQAAVRKLRNTARAKAGWKPAGPSVAQRLRDMERRLARLERAK